MCGSALVLLLLLNVARGVAVPVLVAGALAYVGNPAVNRLQRLGLGRAGAVAVLFAAALLGLTGALLYLVPALNGEFGKLPAFFVDIAHKAVPRLEALLGQPLPADLREAATALGQQGSGLAGKLLPSMASISLRALGGTASLLSAAVGLVVIPVLSFYLLRDYEDLKAFARGLMPRRHEALLTRRFGEVDGVLGAFVRGQLTVGAILSALYAVGLSFAGLDLAVVIGLVAGFGNMIPYFGTGVGLLFTAVALAIGWQGTWQLAVVAVTFAVVQALEGVVITPRVLGDKVGLSPLAVMVALLAFGEAFGFVGVLLAVPTTAALKVAARAVLHRYRRTALFRGAA